MHSLLILPMLPYSYDGKYQYEQWHCPLCILLLWEKQKVNKLIHLMITSNTNLFHITLSTDIIFKDVLMDLTKGL